MSTFNRPIVAKDDNFTVNDGGWSSFDEFPRQLGDINGDGRDDIIGFGGSSVFVSLGQSNGTFGELIEAKNDDFTDNDGGWSSFDEFPRQIGDVNGDGRDDIVGFGSGSVFVSLGQSNGTFGELIVARDDNFNPNSGWSSFDEFPRKLGDINGDGRDDIVGFGSDAVLVSLGQSNGTFSEPFIARDASFTPNSGWSSFDEFPRQLGDVNGDGRDDIIGFASDAVVVSLAQDNGTFGEVFVGKEDNFAVNRGWSSFDEFPRQIKDVNGDGRDDIVGFGDDAVFVSLGQSDGTFGDLSVAKDDSFTVNDGGWSSFDRLPRQLGDVNGDGRNDIIGFGNDAVFVSLA